LPKIIRYKSGAQRAVQLFGRRLPAAPATDEGDKILYIFDGGVLTTDDLARITFTDGEACEVQHVDPAQLDELMPARLARRLRVALNARRDNRTIYAEHGDEVPALARADAPSESS
jgi:hypothetical protein